MTSSMARAIIMIVGTVALFALFQYFACLIGGQR